MRRPATFLAGLTPEEFLAQHFQKRPLLVRGALPGYVSPVSAEELAGLALEPEVESRVVRETAGSFQLERGPFDEAFFAGLPKSRWTLLVQDLDQHVPAVAELFELLDFLPSFRLDDVMASYAVEEGSVGPHFDQYDVFLLQVSGRRRWRIARNFEPSQLRDDTELCILVDLVAEAEWVLEPGDLLYLPPGVAHHGVALDPCITFSLGCRAPSVAELLGHYARSVMSELGEERRYTDPDLGLAEAGPVLSPRAVARAEQLLHDALRPGPDALARSFAALVTEPKALFASDGREPLDPVQVRRVVEGRKGLRRRIGSRWLCCDTGRGRHLFVDGQEFLVEDLAREVAEALCVHRHIAPRLLGEWRQVSAARALLEALVREGFLERD